MCGKYTLLMGVMDDKMNLMIEICNNNTNKKCEIILREKGEICPNDTAPALMIEKQMVTAMAMRWGICAPMSTKLIINARAESAHERQMFSQLVNRQRCAMPAAGYFEWRDEDKVRHQISLRNGQCFYLAGLYRYDDTGIPRFVVLTRNAYGDHAAIHNRMPCLLYTKEEARQWISGEISLEYLCARRDEELIIEMQEHEQLKMNFED